MTEETYSTGAAICPYCGHANLPEDSDYTLYDESLGSFECAVVDEWRSYTRQRLVELSEQGDIAK